MDRRHGRHVFPEHWDEADSGDRLQASKYAEEIIFSDQSAVRWTSFGWEPVDRQSRVNSWTEADMFINHQIEAALPDPDNVQASMHVPFEIAPNDLSSPNPSSPT